MNFFSSSQRIALIRYFPLEVNGGRFLSLLVAFRNTATRRHSEIKRNKSTTKQEFSGEAFSKQTYQSLTSLASIRLVPGADRVVRHICIRCMEYGKQKKRDRKFNTNKFSFTMKKETQLKTTNAQSFADVLRCMTECSNSFLTLKRELEFTDDYGSQFTGRGLTNRSESYDMI